MLGGEDLEFGVEFRRNLEIKRHRLVGSGTVEVPHRVARGLAGRPFLQSDCLFLGQSYAIHRRYTECPILCVPYGSLQGVTVRPVPCNYYVIQQDIALSRRRRGFKSRPARQFNNLREKYLLSV